MRRPRLSIVGPAPRRRAIGALVAALCAVIFFGLLALTALQVTLAQNQEQLDRVNREVQDARDYYDRLRLAVAPTQSPDYIVPTATDQLGMVPATASVYLTPTGDVVKLRGGPTGRRCRRSHLGHRCGPSAVGAGQGDHGTSPVTGARRPPPRRAGTSPPLDRCPSGRRGSTQRPTTRATPVASVRRAVPQRLARVGERPRPRLVAVLVFALAGFALLLGRVALLQTAEASGFRRGGSVSGSAPRRFRPTAARSSTATATSWPSRSHKRRSGPILASSSIPRARRLAPVLGLDAERTAALSERVAAVVGDTREFAYVARQVDDAVAAQVQALRLPGSAPIPSSSASSPARTSPGA